MTTPALFTFPEIDTFWDQLPDATREEIDEWVGEPLEGKTCKTCPSPIRRFEEWNGGMCEACRKEQHPTPSGCSCSLPEGMHGRGGWHLVVSKDGPPVAIERCAAYYAKPLTRGGKEVQFVIDPLDRTKIRKASY